MTKFYVPFGSGIFVPCCQALIQLRHHHFPLLWSGHTRTFALPWLLVLMLLGLPSPARSDDFIQENTFFWINIGGRTFRLEGLTVKRADASGRLPIALITHGKPDNLQNMLDNHATGFIGQAKDLAHRGWLAVVVIAQRMRHSSPESSPAGAGQMLVVLYKSCWIASAPPSCFQYKGFL